MDLAKDINGVIPLPPAIPIIFFSSLNFSYVKLPQGSEDLTFVPTVQLSNI